MIRDYFETVNDTFSQCPFIFSQNLNFIVVDFDRGYWKGNFELREKFELYLFEYIILVSETTKVQDYRYHFQDDDENLVFRFDNAPHHPSLENFPNHLHFPEKVVAAEKPSLEEVLQRALMFCEITG